MKKLILFLFFPGLIFNNYANAIMQNGLSLITPRDTITKAPLNWFQLDMERDMYPGLSTERAYKELLTRKKSKNLTL